MHSKNELWILNNKKKIKQINYDFGFSLFFFIIAGITYHASRCNTNSGCKIHSYFSTICSIRENGLNSFRRVLYIWLYDNFENLKIEFNLSYLPIISTTFGLHQFILNTWDSCYLPSLFVWFVSKQRCAHVDQIYWFNLLQRQNYPSIASWNGYCGTFSSLVFILYHFYGRGNRSPSASCYL